LGVSERATASATIRAPGQTGAGYRCRSHLGRGDLVEGIGDASVADIYLPGGVLAHERNWQGC